jgi:hypothetical protein
MQISIVKSVGFLQAFKQEYFYAKKRRQNRLETFCHLKKISEHKHWGSNVVQKLRIFISFGKQKKTLASPTVDSQQRWEQTLKP